MSLRAKLTILLVAGSVLAMGSCATGNVAVTDAEAVAIGDDGFSAVMNRGWILSEIRAASQTVILDRDNHVELGFGDIFTLRFGDDRVYGIAMPNSFSGPFTLGAGRALTFGPMINTMMAALMEQEEITEGEFLGFLSNVSGWDLVDGTLELHTVTEYGTETVLVFVGN